MTEQIATVFAKNDCYSQLTEFVLACMNENLPQNGSWQTAVIVWNVRNNPRVAEIVLDLGLLLAYEREVVREACEGQGFWEMALATVKEEELLANGNKAEV
jgi:clathrin heavy chain